MNSALFVFEGPDGVGKSTLAMRLSAHLTRNGFASEIFSFPGRVPGTIGEHIYRLYHNPGIFGVRNFSVISEQLLFAAAHADVIENEILPALTKGFNVVLDRYWWSTWVYSRIGNLNPEIGDLLLDLESKIWRGVKPTCIFLVHRDRPGDSEHTPNKWQHLVSLYENLRLQQSGNADVIPVDNRGEIEDAFTAVLNSVNAMQL